MVYDSVSCYMGVGQDWGAIYLAIQELTKLTLVKSGMTNFDIHSFLFYPV
jgi:hypothetical protein